MTEGDIDVDGPVAGSMSTRPGRLFVLALVGVVLLATAYVLSVRTFPGQRLDDLAFEGRKATYLTARRASTFLVDHLTVPAVVCGALAILAVSARRRNWLAGGVAVLSIVGTIGAARLLKAVLPRPEISDLANATLDNTFPSGHSAAILATLLAGLSIGSDRFRRLAMPLAVVTVVGYSTAMIGSGWHRPSDVGGGLFLAVAVVSLATGARSLREGPVAVAPTGWSAGDLGRLLLAVSVVPAVLVVTVHNPPADPRHSLALYVVSVVTAAVIGTSGILAFVAAMRERGQGSAALSGPGTGTT